MKLFKILLITIIGSIILFKPATDPDFGWHYKYGQYIFNNKNVLRQDIFSYTMPGYKWVDSYWASELTLYTLPHFFGLSNSFLIFGAFFTFILCLILSKYLNKPYFFWFCIYCLIFFGFFSISVRSAFLVSLIFFLILFYILYDQKKYYWLLPIIFLFWANFHADFVIGLFCLFIANIYNLFNKKQFSISLAVFSVLCIFGTLVNPWGIGLWQTMIKEGAGINVLPILEWLPLKAKNDSFTANIVYFVFVSVFFSGTLLAHLLKKTTTLPVVISGIFFVLSYRYAYFIRILEIASVFSLLYCVDEIYESIKGRIKPKPILKIMGVYLSVLFFMSVFQAFLQNVYVMKSEESLAKKGEFPYGALEYLRQTGFKGNILNTYEWGGYMIWKYPEYKTFTDGRMTNWVENDNYVAGDQWNMAVDPKRRQELFDKYIKKFDIKVLLVKTTNPLCDWAKEKGYKNIYPDDISCMYAISN